MMDKRVEEFLGKEVVEARAMIEEERTEICREQERWYWESLKLASISDLVGALAISVR